MADAERRNGATVDGRGASVATGPTRTGTAVVCLVSVVAAVALLTRVGPVIAVAVGFAHATAFAASLWLVGRERWQTLATAAAGVLALFVAASFAVAVGYASLDLLASLYPAPSVAQIRPRGVRIVSATLAVVGGIVAMVGALATAVDSLSAERAWAYAKLSIKTFVGPLLFAAFLLLTGLIARLGDASVVPVVGPLVERVGGAVGALVAPVPGRTHLLTFCLLLAATALASARALDALPVAELSTPRTDDRIERTVTALDALARRTAVVTAVALPVTLVEVVLPPETLRGLSTAPVYDTVAAVTAARGLRTLLVGLALVATCVVVTVWLLRRATRAGTQDVFVTLTPFVGGAVVVAFAVAVHGVVLGPTLAFVADALPGQFATAFERQSTAIVDFYGSLAVVVTGAAMLVGMTAVLSLALALVTTTRTLPESAPAPALAAAGTFAAAAFAAGSNVGAPLVLGGLVASFVVWDAGEFGTTLGRAVGSSTPTATPEVVHVGATVAVGLAGALAAVGIHRFATGSVVPDVTTLPFALVAVVGGLVLLVVALR